MTPHALRTALEQELRRSYPDLTPREINGVFSPDALTYWAGTGLTTLEILQQTCGAPTVREEHNVRWWLMHGKRWGLRFLRAEGPCWKGELQVGPFVLGWQRNPPVATSSTGNPTVTQGRVAR